MKKSRLFKVLLTVAIMLAFVPMCRMLNIDLPNFAIVAHADTLKEGPYEYEIDNNGNATIRSYNGSSVGCLTIPSKLGRFPVTGIGYNSFEEHEEITSVVIPKDVKFIGDFAFESCTNLASIDLNDGLETIGWGAFWNCVSLKKVTIPNTVTELGGLNVFGRCVNLESVTLSNGLKEIPDQAFADCTNLKSIVIPQGVNKIDEYAFCNCVNLVSVTMSNTVTYIGPHSFENCRSLKKIKLPNSLTEIGSEAFRYCVSLTDIVIPNSVTNLGNWGGNFKDCTNLKNVKIGNGLWGIKGDTFKNCVNLSKVILTSNTKEINKSAFENCSNLSDVYYIGTKKQFSEMYIGENNAFFTTAKIHYHTHAYKLQLKNAATFTENGKMLYICSCGDSYTKAIAKASDVVLNKSTYAYDGKKVTPTVTFKDSNGKTLKKDTDYTVSYPSGRTNIGPYKVKVTLKGNYSGTKTLAFKIIPANVKSLKATQTTSSVKLSWGKVAGTQGYTVYRQSGKKWVKVADTKSTTYTVKKLKAGTNYKFAVKAYAKSGSKTYYSASYTNISTSTKPGTPALKATAGAKKATLSWNKQSGASGYVVYMATSKNGTYKKIATVKGGTKVSCTKTGLTKGRTYYFKVAAYKTVSGKNIYGAYSAVKSVKAK